MGETAQWQWTCNRCQALTPAKFPEEGVGTRLIGLVPSSAAAFGLPPCATRYFRVGAALCSTSLNLGQYLFQASMQQNVTLVPKQYTFITAVRRLLTSTKGQSSMARTHMPLGVTHTEAMLKNHMENKTETTAAQLAAMQPMATQSSRHHICRPGQARETGHTQRTAP